MKNPLFKLKVGQHYNHYASGACSRWSEFALHQVKQTIYIDKNSICELKGEEWNSICTNVFYYIKEKNITILETDEPIDLNTIFEEYYPNYNKLWHELNEKYI